MKFKLVICFLLCTNMANTAFAVADKIASVAYVLVPYRIKDKWGFSDQKGNMKISPVYDQVLKMNYYFTDGKSFRNLMVVKKGAETFVINHFNQIVVPGGKGFDYFRLDPYNYETVIVGQHNNRGLYFNGAVLIPCIYDEVEKMSNLTFKVRKVQLQGLINSKGKVVIPVKYNFVGFQHVNSEQFTWNARNDLKEKSLLFEDQNIHDDTPASNHMGATSLRSEILNVVRLNLDSAVNALKTNYSAVQPDVKYPHLVYVVKNSKKGLYNVILKKLVIPCEYEEVMVNPNFSAEIIIKVKKQYYGFVGEWGNIQAPCIFDAVLNKEAPFLLVKGKSIGMLSESIHYIKPEYTSIENFEGVYDGVAGKKIELFRVKTSLGQTGIINNEGFKYFKD